MVSEVHQKSASPSRRTASFLAVGFAAAVTAVSSSGSAAARSSRETVEARPAGVPLMAIVALGEQRITVYDADGKMLQAPVSTGQTGYETPAGIYSVIQKKAEHYSNLYDDASMPFMQRITWSGIALHAGVLPGRPASHGCVRMPYDFAQTLFEKTSRGMRVIVVPRDVAPADVIHTTLFKPKTVEVEATALTAVGNYAQVGGVTAGGIAPKHMQALRAVADTRGGELSTAAKKAEEARQAAVAAGAASTRFAKALRIAERDKTSAEAQLKQAEGVLDEASASSSGTAERAAEVKAAAANRLAEAQIRLDSLKSEGQPKLDAAVAAREAANLAEAARVVAIVAAREANAKMLPVSVFVSREAQRLYVRQAFQPLFETPVTISEASSPLGTHVYMALAYTDGGARIRWSVVSMSKSTDSGEPRSNDRRHRAGTRDANARATDTKVALAALDRITIPQEAIDRISEVISPGSALIVSDEAISDETGTGTDFIVLMSGEPQGGIKIRKRKPDAYYRSYRLYQRSPYGQGQSSWW